MDILGMIESEDRLWMKDGACRHWGHNVMFPTDGTGVTQAKQICGTCPVKGECLEYALANHIDHGVWGGMSERERRRILKQRRAAA